MKTDRLFTSWNCSDCSEIKNELDMSFVIEDDKLGKNKQHLLLFQSFSNIGAQYLINKFANQKENLYTPLLITNDNEIIKDVKDIIIYLKEQGFNKQ